MGASLVLLIAVTTALAVTTGLPNWAAGCIGAATTGTVERLGQWWYTRGK